MRQEACYINGCEREAEYRVEAFPIGTRLEPCWEHIATAVSYITTFKYPALVIPLRFT